MNSDIRTYCMEVDTACNLKCIYCYLGESKRSHKMTKEVADKSLEFIFKTAKENNIDSISGIIFIGGEPLLNFELIKYVVEKCKYFEQKGFAKVNLFNIITNATLLSQDIINYINKEKINLQISLDGNKEVHNDNRASKKNGIDFYDKIMESLAQVDHSLVNFRATITKKSIRDFNNDVIAPFNKIGVDYSLIPATCQNKNVELSVEEIEENAKIQVASCFEDVNNGEKIINTTIYLALSRLLNGFATEIACNAGRKYVAIGYDGTLLPCHRFFSDKPNYLGNVFTGLEAKKKEFFENINVNNRVGCCTCEIRFICGGGCYSDSIVYHNDINQMHPVSCTFKKVMVKETFKNFLKLKKQNPIAYENITHQILKDMNDKKMDPIEIIPSVNNNSSNISRESYFTKNSLAETIDLDEEGLIFVSNMPNKRYIANTTTMSIWDLIDGRRSAQDIAHEIANACEVNLAVIEADIYKQLSILQQLGLIEEVINN